MDALTRGARKRKAIADANAEKVKAVDECDVLREALSVFEEHLGT